MLTTFIVLFCCCAAMCGGAATDRPDRCGGPNEFYSCAGACDNVCATLSTQNRTHCPVVNIVCNQSCYCEDGFARDERGQCVPQEQCHE